MNSKNPNDKVPDLIYNEMVEMYGKERADEIVEKDEIDFRYITMQMYSEKIIQKTGVNFWIIFAVIAILAIILLLSF